MYKCIEGFTVNVCDGDGFLVDDKCFTVEEGSIWELNEESVNVLGADVHLENGNSWLEISREVLETCFVKLYN